MYDSFDMKNDMLCNLRLKIKRLLDKTPLWLSFVIIAGTFLFLLTLVLSYSNYLWNRNRLLASYASSMERTLDLKTASLEHYLDDLSDFAVLPVNDRDFYYQLHQTAPVSEQALQRMRQTVSIYYYTRGDLVSYQLYLLQQDIGIGRFASDQRMKLFASKGVTGSDGYIGCINSRTGSCLLPAGDGALFAFYHTMIRISDRHPIALVGIEVNDSFIKSGMSGLSYALYRNDGTLLYTNAAGSLSDFLNTPGAAAQPDREHIISAGDARYIYATSSGSKYGIRLVSYTPVSAVTDSLQNIRSNSIRQGLLFLVLSLVLVSFILRFLTEPLDALARSQASFGRGNFSKISLGRSREVSELTSSYNEMSEQIQNLIQENYVSKINEKTAQLTALEAQVNPHFLYNTLQAIGSEALLNDENEIYEMLLALAGNLHYSIKAPNINSLRDELTFTQNYVRLQKLRMGEKLYVSINIDDSLLDVMVPKCSLQPLVENSISHGIKGDRSTIHIHVFAEQSDNLLCIHVKDDGAGMDADTLLGIRQTIQESPVGLSGKSIGLANLYHRLRLMYGSQCDLLIDSKPELGTEIILKLVLPPSHMA